MARILKKEVMLPHPVQGKVSLFMFSINFFKQLADLHGMWYEVHVRVDHPVYSNFKFPRSDVAVMLCSFILKGFLYAVYLYLCQYLTQYNLDW
jgi:hypothetical protein